MSHWQNPTINLGIIKAGSPKKVTFIGLEGMPQITNVVPYCGCTTTEHDKVNNKLTITYSNSPIPNQVQGPQSITKRIDVIYEDGLSEILTITATRTR